VPRAYFRGPKGMCGSRRANLSDLKQVKVRLKTAGGDCQI
jgi:hypothetical protein